MRPLIFIVLFALFLCVPAVMLDASSYSGTMRKGNRFYKNELYSEALDHYLMGKKKNKNAEEPVFNAGAARYKMQDYTGAIESFELLLQSEKPVEHTADIHYNLGNNYYKLGDYEKAVHHFIESLKKNPNNVNCKYNLELALQKLKESAGKTQKEDTARSDAQKQRGKEAQQDAPGDNSGEETRKSSSQQQEADRQQSAAKPADQKELSREEAQRLISSVNSDQTNTIGDIIKQKITRTTNEKDW
jgi:Ca-activated chloride channel family protein